MLLGLLSPTPNHITAIFWTQRSTEFGGHHNSSSMICRRRSNTAQARFWAPSNCRIHHRMQNLFMRLTLSELRYSVWVNEIWFGMVARALIRGITQPHRTAKHSMDREYSGLVVLAWILITSSDNELITTDFDSAIIPMQYGMNEKTCEVQITHQKLWRRLLNARASNFTWPFGGNVLFRAFGSRGHLIWCDYESLDWLPQPLLSIGHLSNFTNAHNMTIDHSHPYAPRTLRVQYNANVVVNFGRGVCLLLRATYSNKYHVDSKATSQTIQKEYRPSTAKPRKKRKESYKWERKRRSPINVITMHG